MKDFSKVFSVFPPVKMPPPLVRTQKQSFFFIPADTKDVEIRFHESGQHLVVYTRVMVVVRRNCHEI